MKTYLFTLIFLFTLPTSQASVSKKAEDILQSQFSNDKTFKKHARKALRENIMNFDDQEKLIKAVALYRPNIQSASDLSKLFDLLAQPMTSGAFDDFTSKLDIIIKAYSDNQNRLKGEIILKSMSVLSTIQRNGFLTPATNGVVKFLTIPEFGNFLNFSRFYLVDCFLMPLSQKSTWDEDLTNSVIEDLNIERKKVEESGRHINEMNIGELYGVAKNLIEKSP